MQIFSNLETVGSKTVQDLKYIDSQSSTIEAKKGEQLVSLMPALEKTLDLVGDDIVELSAENDSLKNEIGFHDDKWLEETEAKLLKQFNGEKRAN